MLSFALSAYGFAFRDADPVRALDALHRSLAITQDSGNRFTESIPALGLDCTEAEHGRTASAFDHLALAIRNYHDSGNPVNVRSPLAVLAALFDRLGRYEPAATIAGFALSPLSAHPADHHRRNRPGRPAHSLAGFPEVTTAITHLRDVLAEATYESLARKGETMTTAEMVTYAYDQIDQARTELEQPS